MMQSVRAESGAAAAVAPAIIDKRVLRKRENL